MMKNFLIVAAAAAAIAAPAFAQSVPTAAVRAVSYADLDLNAASDRQALERRIERAARSICAVNPVIETQAVAAERKRCIDATTVAVTEQVTAAVRASKTQTAGL